MAKLSWGLMLALAITSGLLHAETMPDRPAPDMIIENMHLPPPSPLNPSKLVIINPIKQAPLLGMRDGQLNMAANEIGITFDDGPTEHTTEVLKILRDYGVKATFFLVGHNIKNYPEKVIEILREGHSVGNHTWNHYNLQKMSTEQARKEIEDTKEILERIVNEENRLHPDKPQLKLQPFFRFPEGAGAMDGNLQNLLSQFTFDNGQKGYANFFWRMSVHDSRTQDANIVLTVAVKKMLDVYKGGIILMHETRPWTRKMLPYFLQILKDRNYTPVYFQAAEPKQSAQK